MIPAGSFSRHILQLGGELAYGGNIEIIGQINVSGQGIALLAVNQDLDPRDSREIRGKSLD